MTTNLPTLPDFTQMKLECDQLTQCKGNLTSWEVASIQDFLYSVPQQLELKVTNPDQEFDVFFGIMNTLITKNDHYGLFQQVVKGDTQSSFYLLSPTTTQIIEDNREFYEYKQWVKKIYETGFVIPRFTRKDLRSIARYYTSNHLDSTAETYYREYMGHSYWRWLEGFTSFQQAQIRLSARLADLSISDTPLAYKNIEIFVVKDLIRRMREHFGISSWACSAPFHIQFLTQHS